MSSDETLSLSWNFLITCFSSVLCKKPLLVTTRRNAAPTGPRFATWRGFSPTGRQNLDGHFSTESRYAITISFPAFQYLFTGAVFYHAYSTESSDISTPVIQLHGAKISSLKVGGFLVYASLVPFPCFRRNLVTCPAVSTPCQLSPSSASSHIRVFCQHPSLANKTFFIVSHLSLISLEKEGGGDGSRGLVRL